MIMTFIFFSCSSRDYESSSYQADQHSRMIKEDGEMMESRVVKTYIVSKSKMKITGLCYVEADKRREPCENITIHLIDHENEGRLETVTDEIGAFSFLPTNRNLLDIEIVSLKYKLKAGKVLVQAGSQLTIILIKK